MTNQHAKMLALVLRAQMDTGSLAGVKAVRSTLGRPDREALNYLLNHSLLEESDDVYRVTVKGLWKLGQQPSPECNVAQDMIGLCDALLSTHVFAYCYREDSSRTWSVEEIAQRAPCDVKAVHQALWFLKDLAIGASNRDDQQRPTSIQLNESALDASTVEGILQHHRWIPAWNASHRLGALNENFKTEAAKPVLAYLNNTFPTTQWEPGIFYLEHSYLAQVDGLLRSLGDFDDDTFDDPEQKRNYSLALSATNTVLDAWKHGVTSLSLSGANRTTDPNPLAVIHRLMSELARSDESQSSEAFAGNDATTWTLDQQKIIRKSFYTTGSATCPNDDAILLIKEKKFAAGHSLLVVSCPLCVRRARPYGTGGRAQEWEVQAPVPTKSLSTPLPLGSSSDRPVETWTYLPQFCSYLQAFFSSKYPTYFDRMNECGRLTYSDEEADVVQGVRDIVHNISEEYSDLRIPHRFASPRALVKKIEVFSNFLRQQRAEVIEPRVSAATDGYSYQLGTLDELNAEMSHALDYALEMPEVSSSRTSMSGPSPKPRVQLQERTAGGAHGSIWIATDELARTVAVKLISPSMAGHGTAMEHAKALARSQHPNVVFVCFVERMKNPDTGLDDDAIVMEWIDGETWGKRMQRRMIADEVFGLGTGVMDAIEHMHKNGLTHGDLHEDNIMVVASIAKVIDPLYRASDTLALLSSTPRAERIRRDVRDVVDRLADALDAMETPRGSELRSRTSGSSAVSEVRLAFIAVLNEAKDALVGESPLGLSCVGRACIHEEAQGSYRRIRVTNHGNHTIRNVEIQLEEFTPQGATFLPVRLQRMHGLPQPFDLTPGSEAYVDVVARVSGAAELLLCYDRKAYPDLANSVTVDDYILSLVASGDDIHPTRRNVRVHVASQDLVMQDEDERRVLLDRE